MAGMLPNKPPPEAQAQYDAFVNNAYKIIYSKESFPQFIQRLQQSAQQDPVEGLASVTALVVARVAESAKRNGQTLPTQMVLKAGMEVMQSLADTCDKAGIHEFAQAEMDDALRRAAKKYAALARESGLVDPQESQERMQVMQQADQAGVFARRPKGEMADEGAEPAEEEGMDQNEAEETMPRRGRM